MSGPSEELVEADDTELLTAKEIKQKLRDLGISTKLRNLKKLRELLKDSLVNKENIPNNHWDKHEQCKYIYAHLYTCNTILFFI